MKKGVLLLTLVFLILTLNLVSSIGISPISIPNPSSPNHFVNPLNPFSPVSPISPLNPANPLSPLHSSSGSQDTQTGENPSSVGGYEILYNLTQIIIFLVLSFLIGLFLYRLGDKLDGKYMIFFIFLQLLIMFGLLYLLSFFF